MAPLSPGASQVTYVGVVRGDGLCEESSLGADTATIDTHTPAPGTLLQFLIRAENTCGSGSFSMSGIDLTASAYTGATSATVSTTTAAAAALTSVKSAINQLATDRATLGANISRLSFTSEQLSVLRDNLSAANSRIKDVDVADESTQFARYNILVQAGTAMLAQANAVPTSALRLLS